uniref:CCHC-type domain-containing protein n=1 Tax=Amphimedon queenslandica TaxID=400682 RepID=A0A1X7T4I1_AMPQE
MLKTMGLCFLSLRKGHITRNCPSGYKCMKCNGMHHVSLCYGNRGRPPGTQGAPSGARGAYGGALRAHGGARGALSGAQGIQGDQRSIRAPYEGTATFYNKTVIYVITIQGERLQSRFVTSKTCVAPTNTPTTPRLELIGALLLSRLIAMVTRSLSEVISLKDPVCYTYSLYWIYGLDRDWKPFIQNRVEEIRKFVPPSRWKHFVGADNLSDIPSRGISMMELQGKDTWFRGPDWLTNSDTQPYQITEMPEECALELKANERRQTLGLLTTLNENSGISSIIPIQK